MKCGLTIFLSMLAYVMHAQEIPQHAEQQLENHADATGEVTEDDSYMQELEQFRKRPVNLNTADADELKQLKLLNDLQIRNLVAYRNLLGMFISIHELQAVPGLDLITIRRLLPYIAVAIPLSIKETFLQRLRGGDQILLATASQVLEKPKAYVNDSTGRKYLGSPQRLLLRYKYNYKNLLQFGVVADKDAGEQFFKGAQRLGFDFYSLHFFMRKIGFVQVLTLGDFTVNMGQGLIQWQGLAFKKNADVMNVKRQSAVLRPYSSAGEFYFFRGAGITIRKAKAEATVFASLRKLDANFSVDTSDKSVRATSFLTNGYHRSIAENEDRNKFKQTSVGAVLIYKAYGWHIALNGIVHQFSLPLQKRDESYNLHAIQGKSWYNASVDYSYTFKNLHLFGEAAIDKQFNRAFLNGLLVSVDQKADVSLVYRHMDAGYQSVNGNAFTENTMPGNERGLYAGIVIRPAPGWQWSGYADVFSFPWLKYQADAPGRGREFLTQLVYTPNKRVEAYMRYRSGAKAANQPDNATVMNYLSMVPRKNWRVHLNYKLNTSFTIRNRVEVLVYGKETERQNGFTILADCLYRPQMNAWSGAIRLQYFESDGYESRIYAYENDVSYSYSIPSFSDQGFRYYLIIGRDFGKNWSFWVRWAQTIYRDKRVVGSGVDETAGNRRSEVKMQARWAF